MLDRLTEVLVRIEQDDRSFIEKESHRLLGVAETTSSKYLSKTADRLVSYADRELKRGIARAGDQDGSSRRNTNRGLFRVSSFEAGKPVRIRLYFRALLLPETARNRAPLALGTDQVDFGGQTRIRAWGVPIAWNWRRSRLSRALPRADEGLLPRKPLESLNLDSTRFPRLSNSSKWIRSSPEQPLVQGVFGVRPQRTWCWGAGGGNGTYNQGVM